MYAALAPVQVGELLFGLPDPTIKHGQETANVCSCHAPPGLFQARAFLFAHLCKLPPPRDYFLQGAALWRDGQCLFRA